MHTNEVEIFIFGPGTALSMGATHLSVDPRYPQYTKTNTGSLGARVVAHEVKPRRIRVREMSRSWLAVPLGLAALTLLALALRTTELGIGFWIDEGLSVGISDRPLTDIPDALQLDGSPPLYYMLMHVWMGLTGTSEEATRWFSVLCVLIAVPVRGGRRGRCSARGGLDGGGADRDQPVPHAIRAGGADVRAGGAARAGGVCGVRPAFTGDDSERTRRPWAIALAVTLALMLYTHNWALFFSAACGAVWLFLVARSSGRARRDLLVTGAIAFGGAISCICRGCRRRSTRPPAPGRRGLRRRTSSTCSARPGRCSGSSRRSR